MHGAQYCGLGYVPLKCRAGWGVGGGGGPVGAEERLYENLNTTTDVQ